MRFSLIPLYPYKCLTPRHCTLLISATVAILIILFLWKLREVRHGLPVGTLLSLLGGKGEVATPTAGPAQNEVPEKAKRPEDIMKEIWELSQIAVFGNRHEVTDVVTTGSDTFSWTPPTLNPIPRKIWQINGLRPTEDGTARHWIDERDISNTNSWLAMNLDYQYNLVGPQRADAFVNQTFAHRPDLVVAYHSLQNIGMKSDWLRYMVIWHEGGTYTDSDTLALRPIDIWVPASLRKRVRLVVGFEWDRRGGSWRGYRFDVQFAQWTFAAAPGHPVFDMLLNQSLARLEDLRLQHGAEDLRELGAMQLENKQVLNSTGPWIWTEALFGLMQQADPKLKSLEELSFMETPRLYGDILLLPINAFTMGRPHSGSRNDGSIPREALAKHLMDGSWRKGKEGNKGERK